MSNSTILNVAVLSASCAALGYYLGSKAEIWLDRPTMTGPPVLPEPLTLQEPEEEEVGPETWDGDLAAITASFMEPCKLVLIVRTDLKMSDGKICADCGTATLDCYKALAKRNPNLLKHWERTGQAKIALRIKTNEQLLELEAIAKSLNLCARSVSDDSLDGTKTVLGIGPAPVNLVNEVTGKLRLF
ncbi:peptidyl-tRNA hydrolase PTH2-domain-containing protein [Mycena floridula]|nr:peptidyl-tRNA hydrolase PTH2-domain-containing protein [Mycena floridula]